MMPPPTPSVVASVRHGERADRDREVARVRVSVSIQPTAPQYTPRRTGSRSSMTCRTRGFGAPVTDAGGNVAAQEVAEPDVGSQLAAHGAHEVGEARDARSSSHSAGTWIEPVAHTRPRSLRARSTIITFSARSFALTSQRARRCAAVPLIGRVSTARPSTRGTARATRTPPRPMPSSRAGRAANDGVRRRVPGRRARRTARSASAARVPLEPCG